MDLDQAFTLTFLVTWLAGAVRLAGPLLLAALGEIYAERAGILNLGIEGTVLLGALTAFLATVATGNPWLGLPAAVLVGLATNLVLAWMYVVVQANQVVTGIVFNLLATGATSYVFRAAMGGVSMGAGIPMLPTFATPGFSDLPVIGPILLAQPVMLYLTLALAFVGALLLYRTRFGLNLRAVGENPKAAAAAGVRVRRMRIIATLISGAGASGAGAYLVLCQIGIFRDGIVQGHGFIALAVVILGRWNPLIAILAALGFGAADALPLSLQLLDLAVAPQLLLALPYLLTILVISGLLGRVSQPAALMSRFDGP